MNLETHIVCICLCICIYSHNELQAAHAQHSSLQGNQTNSRDSTQEEGPTWCAYVYSHAVCIIMTQERLTMCACVPYMLAYAHAAVANYGDQ